jgi:hypothetical protein
MVWEEIEKTLEEKKKKRGFFFFWILGAGMLAGITWGGYAYFSTLEFVPVMVEQQENTNTSTNANANSNSNSDTNSSTNSSTNLKTNSSTDTNINSKAGLSKNPLETVFSTSENAPGKLKKRSGEEISINAAGERQQNINLTVLAETNINREEKATVPMEPAIVKSEKNEVDIALLPVRVSMLEVKKSSLDLSLAGQEIEPQVSTKQQSAKFLLELDGGAGLSLNRLLSLSGIENQTWWRQETEKPWYVWNIGLNAGWYLNDQMYISTGFHYEQLKEKFDYRRTGVTRMMTVYDPAGNPLDSSLVTGTYINSTENVYTMLSLPLSVGYERKKDKWALGFEAGLTINYSLKATGRIFSLNNDIQPLESLMEVHQLGFGVQGAFVLRRYLSDQTSLFVKPGYRFNTNFWDNGKNQTDDNIPSGYHLLKVNMGIRYEF